MKKILLPLLAFVALASCSKSETDPNGAGNAERVAIRLGAGVAATVKAPVVSGDQVDAGIAGWENASAETYAAAPLWSTDISTTANPTTGQAVTWTAQQYYSPDPAKSTYMKAWYPKGTLAGTAVTFPNTDGSVDALLAPDINGNKTTSSLTLAFAHKTTQLKFVVKEGSGLVAGTTIDEIKVMGAQLPTGFDLTKASTDAAAVTYATASDLVVPGITAGSLVIGTTVAGDDAGDPVMIKPITGNTITLDIKTNKATYTGQNVTVTTTDVEEGSAYTITLTFGQAGIDLTATVSDWKPATGTGSIQ